MRRLFRKAIDTGRVVVDTVVLFAVLFPARYWYPLIRGCMSKWPPP